VAIAAEGRNDYPETCQAGIMSGPEAALLTAPVGREVLAELIGIDPLDLLAELGEPLPEGVVRLESAERAEAQRGREARPVRRSAADVVAAAVSRVDLSQVARCRDRLLLLSVVARVIEGQQLDARDSLAAAADALVPVAQALAAAPAASWWWDAVDRKRQRWVGAEGTSPPRGAAVAEAVGRMAATEEKEEEQERSRAAGGRFWRPRRDGERSVSWWSAPLGGAVSTTTGPIDVLPAVELGCSEDSAGEEHVEVWAVGIDEGARVREIGDAFDWAELAAEFPRDVTASRRYDWDRWTGQSGPWVLPDWVAVARDWDGIHLSIGGYLAATGVALTAGNAMTLLAGWEPDQTLWLNDVFTTADHVASWRGTLGSTALPEATLPWLMDR
jgi:hypothetical protein